MSLQFTMNPRCQYEYREAAEHAIETGAFPAGRMYQIVEIMWCRIAKEKTFAIKAWAKDGRFLGYCYNPDEERG